MERLLIALTRHLLTLVAGLLLAFVAMPTFADPPTRAVRISLTSGSASFSPSGSDEWVQARVNRPIWIGDRVWSGDGQMELQLGGASLRLAPRTSLQVLNFDDRIAQFEMTQGSVALHVRAIDRSDHLTRAGAVADLGDEPRELQPKLEVVRVALERTLVDRSCRSSVLRPVRHERGEPRGAGVVRVSLDIWAK